MLIIFPWCWVVKAFAVEGRSYPEDVVKKSSSPSCNVCVVVVVLPVRRAARMQLQSHVHWSSGKRNPLNLTCSLPSPRVWIFSQQVLQPRTNHFVDLHLDDLALAGSKIQVVISPPNAGPRKVWHSCGFCRWHQKMPCSQILYHLFAGAVQMLDCSQYMLQAKQGDCKSIERRKKMPISLISISLIVCKCSGVTSSRRLGVAVNHLISECKERSCVVGQLQRLQLPGPTRNLEQVAIIDQIYRSTCSTGFHVNPKLFWSENSFSFAKLQKALCKTWDLNFSRFF